MKIEVFEMERMQSTWENVVEYDLSESGVLPVSLRELSEMGLDLEWALDTPLTYSQSNGSAGTQELSGSIRAPPSKTSRSPTGPRRPTTWSL